MKTPFLNLFMFCLFSVAIFPSCNNDDDAAITPDEGPLTIDIGDYSLLPESIEQIPYLGFSEIVFVDSAGSEAVFSITEQPLFQSSGSKYFKYDVNEPGDTVHYSFRTEIKTLQMDCVDLNMKLRLSLSAKPYYTDPESEAVADIMEIFLQNPSIPGSSSQVFRHEINTRSYPETFNNEAIPEIEFLGRSFQDVIWNNYFMPLSQVYFNFNHGMVSFTDHDNKVWRFEELR